MTIQEILDAYAREVLAPLMSKPVEVDETVFAIFEDEVSDLGGCETCGPYYDYTVNVMFARPSGFASIEEARRDYWNRKYLGRYTYQGKLSDLLLDIQAWQSRTLPSGDL